MELKRIMRLRSVYLFVGLVSTVSRFVDGFRVDYFPTVCNAAAITNTDVWLESSTGLRYLNNATCTYTVTVDQGRQVLALFKRFELENKLNGQCVDYVNLHDGGDTSGATLNSEPLCGGTLPSNVTSSGNVMTLYFKTDETGSFRGFSLLFVMVNPAPCLDTQFACTNSWCIDASLECDNYNHCSDDSDESNCTEAEKEPDTGYDQTPLILGLTFGLLGFAGLVTAIGAYVYNRNKWRRFLRDIDDEEEDIYIADSSYPVTHKYFKGKRWHPPTYESTSENPAMADMGNTTSQVIPELNVTPTPTTSTHSET